MIPTRPVQDGYALVRVPGLENIPAEWSNQTIGVTNKNGDVLIPNLLPYYGNQVSIADTSVPIDFALDTDRRVIAVPYRGGALITFLVHKIQQITGTLRIQMPDQTIIPALARSRSIPTATISARQSVKKGNSISTACRRLSRRGYSQPELLNEAPSD